MAGGNGFPAGASPGSGDRTALPGRHRCGVHDDLPRAGRRAAPGGVVLDRTGFYPTGGGQPCDLGTLRRADGTQLAVTDVSKSGDSVVHRVARKGSARAGTGRRRGARRGHRLATPTPAHAGPHHAAPAQREDLRAVGATYPASEHERQGWRHRRRGSVARGTHPGRPHCRGPGIRRPSEAGAHPFSPSGRVPSTTPELGPVSFPCPRRWTRSGWWRSTWPTDVRAAARTSARRERSGGSRSCPRRPREATSGSPSRSTSERRPLRADDPVDQRVVPRAVVEERRS